MNIIDDKCKEFRYVLSGCRTITDAHYFADIYAIKYPEIKNIIFSMANGKRYDTVIDFKTMKSILDEVNSSQFRNNIEELVESSLVKTFDNTQKKTLDKILKAKLPKPQNLIKEKPYVPQSVIQHIITKKCPHCNHDYTGDENLTYVICGYQDSRKGYDQKGCHRDWCFKCNKILCKSWYDNKLFCQLNRTHGTECCKRHAIESNKKYPDDYCDCNNEYVNRTEN